MQSLRQKTTEEFQAMVQYCKGLEEENNAKNVQRITLEKYISQLLFDLQQKESNQIKLLENVVELNGRMRIHEEKIIYLENQLQNQEKSLLKILTQTLLMTNYQKENITASPKKKRQTFQKGNYSQLMMEEEIYQVRLRANQEEIQYIFGEGSTKRFSGLCEELKKHFTTFTGEKNEKIKNLQGQILRQRKGKASLEKKVEELNEKIECLTKSIEKLEKEKEVSLTAKKPTAKEEKNISSIAQFNPQNWSKFNENSLFFQNLDIDINTKKQIINYLISTKAVSQNMEDQLLEQRKILEEKEKIIKNQNNLINSIKKQLQELKKTENSLEANEKISLNIQKQVEEFTIFVMDYLGEIFEVIKENDEYKRKLRAVEKSNIELREKIHKNIEKMMQKKEEHRDKVDFVFEVRKKNRSKQYSGEISSRQDSMDKTSSSSFY